MFTFLCVLNVEKMQFIQDNMMLCRSDKSERDEEDAERKATQGTERDTFVLEEDDVATEVCMHVHACSSIQLDYSTDEEGKPSGPNGGSCEGVSLEEEKSRMALLLGTLSKSWALGTARRHQADSYSILPLSKAFDVNK